MAIESDDGDELASVKCQEDRLWRSEPRNRFHAVPPGYTYL